MPARNDIINGATLYPEEEALFCCLERSAGTTELKHLTLSVFPAREGDSHRRSAKSVADLLKPSLKMRLYTF